MGRNPQTGMPEWGGDFPIPMKRPLVALIFAECFKEDVQAGIKRITIREGWRDYKTGDKVVLCDTTFGGWATMGKITQVKHCQLREVPIQDLNDDGMATVEDAINALGQFYNGMGEESLVTVIKWELV